ncbi:Imm1 family immunity protein [Amycolatopsis sp. NPDC059027]|uniref:Imm1 family immunity protein n=1 Tax=unclassified Amycolatopsis TaxID=2618356 RepID=UPI00366C82C0
MIEAWYDRNANGATTVTTADDLDRVLDTVAAMNGPTLAELYTDGDPDKSWLEVGLDGERATLRYVGDDAPNGAYSRGGTFPLPPGGEVLYYYMNNPREYPADAEIPVETARKAAHEFLVSGLRPSQVAWTEQDGPL